MDDAYTHDDTDDDHDDTDDDNDHKNDIYIAAGAAPGASVPCSGFQLLVQLPASGFLSGPVRLPALWLPVWSIYEYPLNFLHGLSSKSSSPINLHTSKQMAGAHITSSKLGHKPHSSTSRKTMISAVAGTQLCCALDI